MAELGNHNTVFTSLDFNGVNSGLVDGPFDAGGSYGTITDFYIWFKRTGGSSSIRPLIYADNAGVPGALIATLTEITITEDAGSWQHIGSLSIAFSTPIWIGFWCGDSANNPEYSYDGAGPGYYNSSLATYSSTGNAPDPWSGGSAVSTQKVAVYVVYTPGAAPQVIEPDADNAAGGWTTTPLFSKVNESSPDGTVITASC